MMPFRGLQTLCYAAAMLAGLLSCCAAQGNQNSSASHAQRVVTKRFAGSASQDVETLFTLISAKSRKLIQETLRQYTKAGDEYPYVYHVIEIAPHARRYRIEDWKPMRAERGTDGGLAGDWAEVVEKGRDSKGQWSDQGGWSLYHRIGGRWQRVAFHEGIGYEPGDFRKARVPREIIRRLKLETKE